MRYVIGFLVSIGLIILLFVWIFSSGGEEPTPAPGAAQRLSDYSNTSTEVQYTEDYRINYQGVHRQLVTTVGRDRVLFQVMSGYDGDVIREQSFANTEAGYDAFLKALETAGYTTGKNDPSFQDWQGSCPQGRRYVFEVLDGSRVIQRLWTTSCGGGSFEGRSNVVRDLFRHQVPEYNKLISGVQLQ